MFIIFNMNYFINFIIIIFIGYLFYITFFDHHFEHFTNDSSQYLKELHDLITQGKLTDTEIDGDLDVYNDVNIQGNLNIEGNIISNDEITGNYLNIDKIILGGKYAIYTKKDAFVIGKIKDNKIAPAFYLNPGSREGLWFVENVENNKIWYYWFNTGKSGHANRDVANLNDILTDTQQKTFSYYDDL